MCELTLQMILLCNCSLSLNVVNIGLQCNLQFLSTTVLQGRVATWVNDGGIFNDVFIPNLLLSGLVIVRSGLHCSGTESVTALICSGRIRTESGPGYLLACSSVVEMPHT